MKTLTLLRHAKSGWDDPGLCDADRPLTDKGRRAARAMGRYAEREGLVFDRVLASPAARVVQTIAAAFDGRIEPTYDKRLYLAPAAQILELVGELPDAVGSVLVVGHNPGMEELVLHLAADGEAREAAAIKFPTATLAQLTWEGSWESPGRAGAALVLFTRPRDLDPTLGPDEA